MVNPSLVDALQKSLNRLGLEPILRSYLTSTFDAQDLHSVKPQDMPKVLKFIADLQDMAVVPGTRPRDWLPPGLRAGGSLIVINGHIDLKEESETCVSPNGATG